MAFGDAESWAKLFRAIMGGWEGRQNAKAANEPGVSYTREGVSEGPGSREEVIARYNALPGWKNLLSSSAMTWCDWLTNTSLKSR